MKNFSNLFVTVFIISGNHEYYCLDEHIDAASNEWFQHIESKIKEITLRLPNVIHLQNTFHDIPNTNLCIYGTTLWSEPNYSVEHKICDYRSIPNFSIEQSCELYKKNINNLYGVLIQNEDKRFIIVSHHIPSYDLNLHMI